MQGSRNGMKKGIFLLWALIILAFASIEFPGIFFINRIEPRIFGLPFIYGFTLIIWFILCVLMFVGYKLKWGYGDKKKQRN
jgi:predicted membrane protein